MLVNTLPRWFLASPTVRWSEYWVVSCSNVSTWVIEAISPAFYSCVFAYLQLALYILPIIVSVLRFVTSPNLIYAILPLIFCSLIIRPVIEHLTAIAFLVLILLICDLFIVIYELVIARNKPHPILALVVTFKYSSMLTGHFSLTTNRLFHLISNDYSPTNSSNLPAWLPYIWAFSQFVVFTTEVFLIPLPVN